MATRYIGANADRFTAGQGPLMFRNRIINGNFDIWQRGTSQTSSGYGSADRWSNQLSNYTRTVSQQAFTLGQTDVPNNPIFFCRNLITAAGSGANDFCFMQYGSEDVRLLAGQTVTLSFWAKADTSKNIATEFLQGFGSGGGASAFVTQIGVTTYALTTSWKKFTTTVTLPSVAGKTLGTDNLHALYLRFYFGAGSGYNASTNSLGNQSGTFDIAQVQLELGSSATEFEFRPLGTELALCQRYYTAHSGQIQPPNFTGVAYSTSNVATNVRFPVTMRNAPAVTLYSYAGTANKISAAGSASDTGTSVTVSVNQLSNNGFPIITDSGAGFSTNTTYWFYYTASAEL